MMNINIIEDKLKWAQVHGPDRETIDALEGAAKMISRIMVERDAALAEIERLNEERRYAG